MAFINQGPSRSALVAQMLKEQQRQHSKAPNPYSWGEAAARVGSRLIDAYMGKKQIDEEMGRRGASADNLQDAITALTEGTTKPGVPVDTVTQDPFAQRPIALDPNVFGTDADVGSAAVAPTVVSALTNMGATSADLGGRPANIPQASTAQDLMGATHVMPDGTTMLNSDMTGAMYETPQMNLGGQPPAGSQMQQAMAQQIAQAGQSQDVVQDRAAGIGAMGQVLMRDPTNASMGADIMFKDAMRQESEERARIAANASRKTERPLTPQELKGRYNLDQLGGRIVMGTFEGDNPNPISARIVNNQTGNQPKSPAFESVLVSASGLSVAPNSTIMVNGQQVNVPTDIDRNDPKNADLINAIANSSDYRFGSVSNPSGAKGGNSESTFADTINNSNKLGFVVNQVLDTFASGSPVTTILGGELESSIVGLQAEIAGNANLFGNDPDDITSQDSLASQSQGVMDQVLDGMDFGKAGAIEREKYKSAMNSFAYTVALINNPDGRISEADYQNALREVGGNLSDPDVVKAVLEGAYDRGRKSVTDSLRSSPQFRKAKQKDKSLTLEKYLEDEGFSYDASPFKTRRDIVETQRAEIAAYKTFYSRPNMSDEDALEAIKIRRAEIAGQEQP